MALKAFTYPLPETRFIHAGRTVYKLKLRYSHHIRDDLGFNRELVGRELEDCVRAVLGNLDNLQPFTTVHFTIFPYKSKWERISELRFKQGDRVLTSYPYVCTLYVELRSDQQHLPVKEGSPFVGGGFVGKVTREAVAAVAGRASEKETKKTQLHPTGKRSRSRSNGNTDDNGSDSETARKKRKKERNRAAVRVDKARGKLYIAGKMTSPGFDHQHHHSAGCGPDRHHHSPGPPEAAAGGGGGGIFKFLSSLTLTMEEAQDGTVSVGMGTRIKVFCDREISVFVPFSLFFGTKRSR